VNIRPLFTDEVLYIFVEIRRQQIVLGSSLISPGRRQRVASVIRTRKAFRQSKVAATNVDLRSRQRILPKRARCTVLRFAATHCFVGAGHSKCKHSVEGALHIARQLHSCGERRPNPSLLLSLHRSGSQNHCSPRADLCTCSGAIGITSRDFTSNIW
jgi:hypothetical protein